MIINNYLNTNYLYNIYKLIITILCLDSLSAESNSDIYINLSARNFKLFMGMDSGHETNHFFNELSRSMDR